MHPVVLPKFVERQEHRILAVEFAGRHREQRASIGESKKRDFKLRLRSIATTRIRTGIGVTGGITTGTIDKTLGYTCRDSYLLNTESGQI